MNRPKTRTLQVESLERRELMAGNVAVAVNQGDLVIQGDNARNDVQVQSAGAGAYWVRGNTIGGGHTYVNGKANQWLLFRGVTDDVSVYLYGGADRLEMTGAFNNLLKVPDELFISGGSSGDTVLLNHVQTARDIQIDTGSGQGDVTNLYNVKVGDDLAIWDAYPLYAGDYDQVSLNGVSANDQIWMSFRGGNDKVEVNNTYADDFYANMGAGNDSLKVTFSNFRSSFNADGGPGYDTFFGASNRGQRANVWNFERVYR